MQRCSSAGPGNPAPMAPLPSTERDADRIADPWGARTPYGGRRAVARARRHAPGGRASSRTTSTAGCSRRRSCTPTATRWTSRCKDGRIVGVRGRAGDRVNHGRLGPKDLYGWQAEQLARPARPARSSATGRRAGRDRLGRRRWTGSSTGRRQLLDEPGGWGASASTPAASSSSRSTTRSRVIGKAGHRHAAHGRQHPAVHGDRGRGAQGERSAPTASPARTPTSTTATRSPCGATTSPRRRPCCGRGCSTAAAGPTRRGCSCVDPRRTPVAREADVHLAPRAGHQPRADERAAPRAASTHGWIDAGVRRGAHRRLRRAASAVGRRLPAGARRGDLRRAGRRPRARRPSSSARAERLLSTVLQGFYQSQPGDGRGRAR